MEIVYDKENKLYKFVDEYGDLTPAIFSSIQEVVDDKKKMRTGYYIVTTQKGAKEVLSEEDILTCQGHLSKTEELIKNNQSYDDIHYQGRSMFGFGDHIFIGECYYQGMEPFSRPVIKQHKLNK